MSFFPVETTCPQCGEKYSYWFGMQVTTMYTDPCEGFCSEECAKSYLLWLIKTIGSLPRPGSVKRFCHDRRVPRRALKPNYAYAILARNAPVGVWRVGLEGLPSCGFEIRRVKFDRVFPFVEYDWLDCFDFGTTIPLWEIGPAPDLEGEALLDWLHSLEPEVLRRRDEEFWAEYQGLNHWRQDP